MKKPITLNEIIKKNKIVKIGTCSKGIVYLIFTGKGTIQFYDGGIYNHIEIPTQSKIESVHSLGKFKSSYLMDIDEAVEYYNEYYSK